MIDKLNFKLKFERPTGFRAYLVMWLGQMASMVGTTMTHFALLVWMWEDSGKATTVTLFMFSGWILFLIVTPFAGVITDRFDRRLILIVSDLASVLVTVVYIVLYSTGRLEIWHVYVGEILIGGFNAFQASAGMAVISLLVPKTHYGRASGMRSFSQHGSAVVAPAITAALLPLISLRGIMIIDVITFLIAVGGLALIAIPSTPRTDDGESHSFTDEIRFGFGYLLQRRGLLWLTLLWMAINGLAALTYFSILSPMVLARSGGSETALAAVQSAMGIGGVVGAVLMSVWGGPKRKIHLVLGGLAVSFLLGDITLGLGRSAVMWAAGGFMAALFIPILVSGSDAIWQSKIPPDVQGRVFSARSWLGQFAVPVGYLISGPLADRVFEPALVSGGRLAPLFGGLVGIGPGAGMGLMFICTGVIGSLLSASGYLLPALRHVEDDLPDHDHAPEVVVMDTGDTILEPVR
ncbi:MAG: MFS transporter [Anaerolineae bacterium]|nr:MFS transporter [Anaerolineae bacterium]